MIKIVVTIDLGTAIIGSRLFRMRCNTVKQYQNDCLSPVGAPCAPTGVPAYPAPAGPPNKPTLRPPPHTLRADGRLAYPTPRMSAKQTHSAPTAAHRARRRAPPHIPPPQVRRTNPLCAHRRTPCARRRVPRPHPNHPAPRTILPYVFRLILTNHR